MIIEFEKTGSVQGLESVINRIKSIGGISGFMILSCDENGFTPDEIDPVLKAVELPVFGGIFPTIVHGKDIHHKGSVVVGLDKKLQVQIIPGLSDPAADYEVILDKKIPDVGDSRTMVLFVDGFSKRIGAFIESLFMVFGLDINYVGGGAGSLTMIQKPCLLSNDGLLQDSAILALLECSSGVGVSHGWKPLKGPFKVTESEQNRIKSLDWRPAFEVYYGVVSSHFGKPFSQEDFFEVSKAYPFGINRLGDDLIVRDPVRVSQDQSLICVGEVPEGSFVSILNGNKETLLEAAAQSVLLSQESFSGKGTAGLMILMDCMSRVLFLGQDFQKELDTVFRENLPMVGACSIGEIANCGGEFLEFYNKTNVIAILEE